MLRVVCYIRYATLPFSHTPNDHCPWYQPRSARTRMLIVDLVETRACALCFSMRLGLRCSRYLSADDNNVEPL